MALVAHENKTFLVGFDVLIMVSLVVFGGAEVQFFIEFLFFNDEAFSADFVFFDFHILKIEGKLYIGVFEFLEDGKGLVVDHNTVGGSSSGVVFEVVTNEVQVCLEDDTSLVGLGILGVAEGADAGSFIFFFGFAYFVWTRLGITRLK